MESITYRIKLKNKFFEFEVEGDKDFVEEYIMKAEDYIELMNNYDGFKTDKNKIQNIKSIEFNPHYEDEIKIPLDAYLSQFDVKAPQKLIIGVALYWLNDENKTCFNSSDINQILKENHLKPIDSISTHIKRLRDKDLLTYVKMDGKLNCYTIYRNQIEEAKKFIMKNSE